MARQADTGVIGGSGFYTFLPDVEEIPIDTPYGPPGDRVALATVEGRRVAFLPRHGRTHGIPPHRVPYQANLWALKQLGVRRVIAPCAAGSLAPHVRPGSIVVCDQLVDRTWGRADTYYDGPVTTHVSLADPYCPQLRGVAIRTARDQRLEVHDRGTLVVVNGPRFSTRAESAWFQSQGWEVVNMTGYPEAALARELEMCYVNLSLITDYDVGLAGLPDLEPVSHQSAIEVMRAHTERMKRLVESIVRAVPDEPDCGCPSALRTARL